MSQRRNIAKPVQWLRSHRLSLALIVVAAVVLATPASGITIISQSGNTTIYLGMPFGSLEFENPLTGTETVLGLKILEWRDADFAWGPPRWYDDWTVNNPWIDGNANEIWLRRQGDVGTTATTVASAVVSIHLNSDSNDGLARVLVDGVEVARLDMYTTQCCQTALIIVRGLSNSTHNIQVDDLGVGSGGGDDVHIMGAAALQEATDDWGDAPDPTYPTLAAGNGAHHTAIGPFLGFARDTEADGQPNGAATGDDNSGAPDDEDGVTFVTTPLMPGMPATVSVTWGGAPAAYLSAWIDFNGDGVWNPNPLPLGETIFVSMLLSASPANLTFTVPATAVPGITYARFRLVGTNRTVPPGGAQADGEVEDYTVQIEESTQLFDYGDAPDPTYLTLLASNGARHAVGAAGLRLGAACDGEINGQPNATATGDDINLWYPGVPFPPGDEDGVVFNTALFSNVPNTITVTVNGLVASAYLNAWIDLNGDGDWADAGEQIFTNQPVAVGPNPLTFTPGNITAIGSTYARFRLSSAQNLNYWGPASDGEVEDYQITIVPQKWLQKPDLDTTGVDVNLSTITLADDFVCTDSGPITDIHLWTSFNYDMVPQPLNGLTFTLQIYADVPAGEDQPYSHPGRVLWSRTFPAGSYNAGLCQGGISEWWYDPMQELWLPNADHACYQYDFTIHAQEAFHQVEGTIYWLGVKLEPDMMYADIGWKTSRDHWNDDACWFDPMLGMWRDLRYGPQHPMWPDSIDLAFALTGYYEQPPADLDFGDAPDSYITKLPNGARHVIGSGLVLGQLIDAEADGQPSVNADADDLNPPIGVDDEDGVTFNTAFFAGVPNVITVTASVPSGATAYLNAWVDFNGDGDWSDPGEQIFTDMVVGSGANSLSFTPPNIVALGTTFARFRLSSVQGLGPAGPAPDGEVEDYLVNIVSAKWIQKPDLTSTGVDVDGHNTTLADDFRCTQTGRITDIHLWTSFDRDILPLGGLTSLTFTLMIYSDVPDPDPTDPSNWSHPGTLLWAKQFDPGTYRAGLCMITGGEWWHDPLSNFWRFPGDTAIYQYDFAISDAEAFRQTRGTIYWLAMRYQQQMTSATLGWKSSLDHWNDDACWLDIGGPVPTWRELRYGGGHPMMPDSMDLAFALTAKPCHRPQQDADGDLDVDLGDFGVFQNCFNGPNRPYKGPPPPASVCACFDDDDDTDVDLVDFGQFQNCFNGPNRPPKC